MGNNRYCSDHLSRAWRIYSLAHGWTAVESRVKGRRRETGRNSFQRISADQRCDPRDFEVIMILAHLRSAAGALSRMFRRGEISAWKDEMPADLVELFGKENR